METEVPEVIEGDKHFLAVFFFSFMWGMFGVDRFYLGKFGTGLLKLLTFGGFGVWMLIDLVLIMSGSMRDKQGHALKEYRQYKKLASRTVLWFAIILGASLLVSGILAIYEVSNIASQLLNGGSGLDQLKQLEQMNQ